MNDDEVYKIIYKEAKKAYEISIESIRAYDKKLQQITLLSTTSLGVFFVIAGFLGIDFSSQNMQNTSTFLPLIAGYFFSFVGSVSSFIIALMMCLKAYSLSEISVMEPKNILDGYKSLPKGSDFLDELIYELDYNFKANTKIASNLWHYYNESIALLSAGFTFVIIFIGLSLMLNIVI